MIKTLLPQDQSSIPDCALALLRFLLFGVAFDYVFGCIKRGVCDEAAEAASLETSCLVYDLPLLLAKINKSRLP